MQDLIFNICTGISGGRLLSQTVTSAYVVHVLHRVTEPVQYVVQICILLLEAF